MQQPQMMSRPRFDPTPSITLWDYKNFKDIRSLVALSDGSFLSSICDGTLYRWSTDNNNYDNSDYDDNSGLRIVGTYEGHDRQVMEIVEVDEDTIVTGAGCALKVWNKTTCECLLTITQNTDVYRLLKTRDGSTLVYKLGNCTIVLRRLSDFQVINTFQFNVFSVASLYCGLEDGTFILGDDARLQHWDPSLPAIVRTFAVTCWVWRVIELRRDIIVTLTTDEQLNIWRVSTGECLHSLNQSRVNLGGLVQLTEGHFATTTTTKTNKTIDLWDEDGNNYETFHTEKTVRLMAKLADGSIITYERNIGDASSLIAIRKP